MPTWSIGNRADAYGNGHNEEFLGKTLGDAKKDLVIGTKFGNIRGPNGERGGTNANLESIEEVFTVGMNRAVQLLAENSWKVTLDEDGKLQWTHDSESTRIQPARSFWQRIQEFFFSAFPKEYY